MINFEKTFSEETYLKWVKIIFLEDDMELFKKTYEGRKMNFKKRDYFSLNEYKYFSKVNSIKKGFEYRFFLDFVRKIYDYYLFVKDVDFFDELIEKFDLKKEKSFFNFCIFYEKLEHIDLFILTKWLGLKPNKKFSKIFNVYKNLMNKTKIKGEYY
jgi:hypothetical protein